MTKLASWDGRLYPEKDLQISPFSATAMYGVNVFEGLRAYWREEETGYSVLFTQLHIRRLLESAKILGIQHPYSERDLAEALYALVVTAPESDIVVRMTLMIVGDPGESWASDIPANLAIRYFVAPSRLDKVANVRVMTSSWTRPSLSSMPMSVKSGANYVNSRYGSLQAKSFGQDMAIFLDRNGYVVEGGGANLVCRKGNEVLFCPPEMPVLRGITQEYVKVQLSQIGRYSVTSRPITLPEIYVCDEILLVGTTAEVISVCEVDGRGIDEAYAGELRELVCRILRNAVSQTEVTRRIDRGGHV